MNRISRIAALALAMWLFCCAFCGCDLIDSLMPSQESPLADDNRTYQNVGGMTFSASPYYTPVQSRYAYAQLNERQQSLYDQLLEGICNVSDERNSELGTYAMKPIHVNTALSVAQMRVTLRALTNDNPYIFWLSQSFSHVTSQDENYTDILPYSQFSPADLSAMLQRTDSALSDFYASVPEGLSPYQREKFVHDYIADTCEYGREIAAITKIDEQNVRGHSVYGALVERRCVCEGYGMTMQLLLNGLGVECVTLTGMSYDGTAKQSEDQAVLHLWNAVRLDGAWYHVDPTWDDQEAKMQRYSYFNLSDDVLSHDHTLSPKADLVDEQEIAENGTENMNLFIPVCSSMDYNYYVYECPHLTGYDSDSFRSALLEAAEAREPVFSFYIDPASVNFDDAIRLLFRDYPQYFFQYIEDVNAQLYDYEIDTGNLTYYMNKDRSSVSVELRYY